MNILSRAVLLLFLIFPFNALCSEKIDINSAVFDDLVKIVHIGEKRALELISLRPFSSLDDLERIKGIGPVRIEEIKKQGLAFVEFNTLTDFTAEVKFFSQEIDFSEPFDSKKENDLLYESKKNETFKIDINTASPQELQKIVGIGPVLSQRIMETRPFSSLDGLLKVHGIGSEILEKIKKQDLAWVETGLNQLKDESPDFLETNLATIIDPFKKIPSDKNEKVSFLVFATAFFSAVFSGIIILFLKKKIKESGFF